MSSFMAVDPSTGHEFAELPETTAEHVAEMVADARRALREEEDWRFPVVRAGALTRLARLVEAEAGALADFETRDTGTPLSRAKDDVRRTGEIVTYYAGTMERLAGGSLPLGPRTLDYSIREPWGVCALILGSAAPLRAAAAHAVPALAAGNAVIVKPSELGSIGPLRLAELAFRAGVPQGLMQVATGHVETGEALASGVDHVTFAGRAATGALVAEACARRGIPCRLDTPGLAAHLVCADGEPDVAAIVRALPARLLVEAEVAGLGDALARLKLAPGIEDPDVGPLISERHVARALAAGGELHGDWFVRPALLEGPPPDEVAGPLVFVEPFREDVAATAVTIWTRDLARAHRLAATIRAERVSINAVAEVGPGAERLLAYTRLKTVRVALG